MTTPQNPSEDSRAEFWTRPDLITPEQGPFQKLTDELLADMHTFRKDLEPKMIGGEKVLATPEVTFQHIREESDGRAPYSSPYITGKAFAFTQNVKGAFGKEQRTYMAIDPDTSNPDMYRFLITEDGQLQEIIGSNLALGESANDVQLNAALEVAVQKISKSLEELRDDRVSERKATVRRIRRVTTGVATVALIAGGVAYGVDRFILKPREEDRIARATYDREQHVLDADEIVVTSADVTTVPKSVIDDIPEWKEGDDFDNPRTIEITGNSCKTIKLRFSNGDSLLLALAQGDPLEGSTTGIVPDVESEKIKICLAGQDSVDSDDTDGEEDKSKLAVQLIPKA